MNERSHIIESAELLAYVDGQLPAGRRAEIEAELSSDPERAAEVAQWQRQDEAIRALFGPVAGEVTPARLSPHAVARGLRNRRTRHWPRLAVAAVLVLGIGLGAGWFGRDLLHPSPGSEQELIADAVTAHTLYVKEKRHAVEVAAADHDHLVSWLSNRVARPISTPDLVPEGFTLVGGRLLPPSDYAEYGPAAQLMYENAAAERVTVYITAAVAEDDKAFERQRRGPVNAFYWANDRITCTVVGALPQPQMEDVAQTIYRQLTAAL